MSSTVSLWLIFFSSLFLVVLSNQYSVYTISIFGDRKYDYKEKIFYSIVIILMSMFIGLRIWCNDTGTYREIYDYLTPSTGNILDGISWAIGDSPAFSIFNTILKHLNVSTQNFLMIYAFITVTLYLWFIRKYTTDLTLSIFLLWTMGVYIFAAAGMRQAVAIAIGLIGIDRFLQKKWIGFIGWICFATFFHPYTILYLLAPIMTFSPWTKKTGWLFAIFAIIGVFLQSFIGIILDITSALGKMYGNTEFSGEGVNIFRFLVVWAPIVLSFLAHNSIKESIDKENNLFMNFSMLNAAIMFVALFGTANYFARLANYFLVFQTLSLPWMLKYFNNNSRKLLRSIIVICYLLYFIFTHMILTPFDQYFAKMTLWEYLLSVFK